MKKVKKAINWVKKHNLFPNPPIVSTPHAPEIIANDKKVLMFATNNYLDLMADPRVIESAIIGLKRWGIGSGSARLLTGNLDIHHELENKIAKFKKKEGALTFVSGYMANSGTIPALTNVFTPSLLSIFRKKISRGNDTVIFSDEYNHASIIAGIRLSKAQKEIYKHCDLSNLKNKLEKYSSSQRKIIITDSVFSMEGDIAPLPEIAALAQKHNAMLYIDDAHGTGILGENGRGAEEHFGMEGAADVVMGTFTKSFGGVGGFIVGSQELIDYLKITADSFIFTAPIAPPIVSGLIKAIDIAEQEPWRRKKVIENADYLKEKFKEININFLNSQTQIIPVLIGGEKKAIKVSEKLLERGIFIPAARWPAVPAKKARLRITVTCSHTKEHLDKLVDALRILKAEMKF